MNKVAIILLSLLVLKGLAFNFDINLAITSLGMIAFVAFQELRLKKQESDEIKAQIQVINVELSKKIEELEKKSEEMKEIKSHIASLKIGQIIKPSAGQQTVISGDPFKF